MTRMIPSKLYIANLEGRLPSTAIGYLPKEEALDCLRAMTGQDFSFDVEKWKEWFKANPIKILRGKMSDQDIIRATKEIKLRSKNYSEEN